MNVKHYLQSPLLAVYHCRSALQLTAQDAVQPAEIDWLVGEQDLHLLPDPLPLSDLTSQHTGERGHVGPELLQNPAHSLQKPTELSES